MVTNSATSYSQRSKTPLTEDGRQIYPPSITGKGARFAAGGSVLDHAFGQSDLYALGV